MTRPLALLPLDDRPVNLAFPRLLASVAGEELLIPPRRLLGRFLAPGDAERLARWLGEALPAARAGVISLDMLAYGGLVASRTPAVPAETARRRFDALREVKRRRPDIRLLAFSVIMRLTITAADAEARAAGRDLFRYSVLRDRAERLGDARAAADLSAAEGRIPCALLASYLEARRRNHAVNLAALELLADGTLDFLSLVQEDAALAGLHVGEQAALEAFARERAPAHRWRLYAGADEAAQTLLARCLLEEAPLPFPVAVALRDAEAAEHPALFEGLPLREAVRRHIDAVGGVIADDGARVLAVHTFAPPQADLFEMAPLTVPTWEAALAAFPPPALAPWLAALGARPWAVADVAYCNGADPRLLDALLAGGQYPRLDSYAGWNTAGNTLGTAVAHAALHAVARARGVTPAMEAAHRRALLTRLIDDGLYQSVVRRWAMARAEESGMAPLNLAEHAPVVEEWIDAAMQALWRELRERYPALRGLDEPFQAKLPWGRLFEIHVEYPRRGPSRARC